MSSAGSPMRRSVQPVTAVTRWPVDEEIVLVQVAVDHAGIETPQRHIFQRMFPAPQQQRRDPAGGRGLIQFVQPALPELIGGIAGQIGVPYQGPGQIMNGGEGRTDFSGQPGRSAAEFLDRPGGAGQMGIHEGRSADPDERSRPRWASGKGAPHGCRGRTPGAPGIQSPDGRWLRRGGARGHASACLRSRGAVPSRSPPDRRAQS